MKKLIKLLLSRIFIVGILILVQAVFLIFQIWKLSNYFVYIYFSLVLLSIVVVVRMVSKKNNPSYKLAWTIPILLFPVFGGLMYVVFGINRMSKKKRKKAQDTYERTLCMLKQDESIIKEIESIDKSIANQCRYIKDYGFYPVYKNTYTEYLSPGEKKFLKLKESLEGAKHYIFLEYFIIEEGVMWNSILHILERKAREGLDVRVIYDDAGCFTKLPYKYCETLRKKGIKAICFNHIVPFLSVRQNNRDHRKIAIIDGHTAFTGGINLADEYINVKNLHGHWKDASILVKGDAVWNLTMTFLQMWDYNADVKEENYDLYKPSVYEDEKSQSDGYVQPYADSPIDDEIVGEFVYMNMINRAKDYIYINTPYLIIDNELTTALIIAAKSGVDVRIVTPHIGDKRYVHTVTRSYYPRLIEAGVKIYEYTPGFIHSKTFVSDDETAVVGTINMDYRSLYLHFECGVFLYKTKSVMELKKDYLNTLEKCQLISLEQAKNVKLIVRIFRSILRLFAPLM